MILVTQELLAQQQVESVEQRSYRLYLQQAYAPMFELHDSLNQNGIDYYYLRIRNAWARNFLNQPMYAFEELKAARKFSQSTENDYLFSKLLIACGYTEAAERLTSRMSKNLTGQKQKYRAVISMLQSEAGSLVSYDQSGGNAERLLGTLGNILGTQERLRGIQTGSIALKHRLIPGISMFHQLSYMYLMRVRETGWRNGYKTYPYSGRQGQYYLSAQYQTLNGWSFSPSLHYIYYHHVSEWTEAALPPGSVISGLDTITLHNYLISGEVSYLWKKFKPSICITAGELNFQKPIQVRPGIIWYPNGNLNIYIDAGITYHQQQNTSTWIPGINAGRVWNNKWMTEAGFTLGNLYNYSELNGRLLFNIADPIRWKAYATFNFRKNLWNISLTLPVQQRERTHVFVVPEPSGGVAIENKSVYYFALGALLQFQFYFPQKP
jgi:hypothetical protein